MHLSRCGLLGDIHAEDERLARALAHFRSATPALDAVLFVGDVVDGEGDLESCLRMLREALQHIAGHPERDKVWFTRPSDIYDHCAALPASQSAGVQPVNRSTAGFA